MSLKLYLGWIPVRRDEALDHDLESFPLEIKTDSALGSGDEVGVIFLSAEKEYAGGVALHFTSTPQYFLGWCNKWTNLPVNPPSPTVKVWHITLTRTAGVRLVIHCNDVEVLNKLLSQATCSESRWRTYWNRDVTNIKFASWDTASDYYKPQPGG